MRPGSKRVRLPGEDREASGGRPGGYAIGIFSKGRGIILPRRAWYKGCEAEINLEMYLLQGVCTTCGLVQG